MLGVTLTLVFRSSTGHVRGKAIARDVRVTQTQFVVDGAKVQVLEGDARFGFSTRRYRRDNYQPIPKPNPLSGNGRWHIEKVEEVAPLPDTTKERSDQ